MGRYKSSVALTVVGNLMSQPWCFMVESSSTDGHEVAARSREEWCTFRCRLCWSPVKPPSLMQHREVYTTKQPYWGAENRTPWLQTCAPWQNTGGHCKIRSGECVNDHFAVVVSGPSVTCGVACSPGEVDGTESRDPTSCTWRGTKVMGTTRMGQH